MPLLDFEFNRGGIYLPNLRLWLDPHDPKTERVFVSHAHSDHTEDHREVILTSQTARLMEARMGGKRIETILPFGEARSFEADGSSFRLTLLPAGHIFGSAMSLIEAEGQSLLYTGDFKLRKGLSAEPCEPRTADVLIMETTFGQPHYQFPPTDAVMKGVLRFCKEALDNDETAVLLGYSLGKSQEILCALADAGLPIMLHGSVHKLTEIYAKFGQCFPSYEKYEASKAKGKVLLCPPHLANSAMLRNLGKTRKAVLTGWAVDPNCRYRYQVDAAFPLSDHADFPDLIEMVKRVNPKKVYTLHGFAADFAQSLRDLGYEAQALSETEQMSLSLVLEDRPKATAPNGKRAQVPKLERERTTAAESIDTFVRFAQTCSEICATSSKLQKTRILADYLKAVCPEVLSTVTTWFTGTPFPSSANKVLQMGWAVLRDAIMAVTNVGQTDFHQVYLKHSDLGETFFEIFSHREPLVPNLTIGEVNRAFHALQPAKGPTGKLPILIDILERCSPLEAKYLVKVITSDLRIGLKEGLVEDAVASAFGVAGEEIRQANLLLGNIGETAVLARNNELASASIVPFRPIKFMLASPEPTAKDIWDRICERHTSRNEGSDKQTVAPVASTNTEPACTAVWIEDKYDGIRCQLHKIGGRVALYSRDLKDITATFHDLAEAAQDLRADTILDGEILAMRGDQVLSFSELQKRLGRKEHDLFMREEVPIKFVAFDLLWLNGETQLNQPLKTRRKGLEALDPLPDSFRLARITPAASSEEIDQVFDAARSRNNEGLMVKDPESTYTPGRRGLAWLKLKKAYATLDCVVVGAEYGHGKRSKVLSDYTFAVRDDKSGELKTIGKAYSGLTDVEIAQLTEHFLSNVVRDHGRYHEVVPDTVLEIAFDKLQPSHRHSSGLAMRFPRILRIRTDKTPADIDTIASARRLVTP
ncbi:MAG TPA: ATP-dependent DNA ligase [Candidatus Saccharimonadales bacterium]|nr:ATP-dependent DNA ligase [Candidatus Saccharimonadales bacterium]